MKRYIKDSKSSPALHSAFDGLDDRFTFDIDDEFEIYVNSEPTTCYAIDSRVFGNGAGLSYIIAIPVGEKDHWQMDRFIERGLNEYFSQLCDGSDYTYGINEVSKDPMFDYDLPSNIDNYNVYLADVEVVPYQNIDPYGEYGIDAGYEG